MKLLKVKKQDARPSIRIKAAGNVFVEVYKDNKGYFYRIDVPGATDFVSKERFESQDKAKLAGTTHAKKFIGKVKGDQKKADYTDIGNALMERMKKQSSALQQAMAAYGANDIPEKIRKCDDMDKERLRNEMRHLRQFVGMFNGYLDRIEKELK